MWLDKSANVTEISSEDFEYLVNRFGTLTAKDVFSKSDLKDLELDEDYPIVVIKSYKEDFEYDLIFAFKVGNRYYKVVRKAHSFRGGMDSTFIL